MGLRDPVHGVLLGLMDANVRGIDKVLWHRLRVEALKRGLTIGALLNQIVREWLEREA